MIGAVVLALAGCGNSMSVREVAEVGVAASCAGTTPAQALAHARLVFDGTMLAGPVVGLGPHEELLSPARVRVNRYLKGHGPRIVRVQTAVSRSQHGMVHAEDGIQAEPGQRWVIYTNGTRQPFLTSICAGSHREDQAPPGMRRFFDAALSFDYPSDWHARRGRFSGTFASTLVSVSPQPLRAECPCRRVGHKIVIACRPPVAHVHPGSMFVSWTSNGEPGPVDLPETPTRVDGLPAKRSITRSNCGVGANQPIQVSIPNPRDRSRDHWLTMTACIRGPQILGQDQEIEACCSPLDSCANARARRPAASPRRVNRA